MLENGFEAITITHCFGSITSICSRSPPRYGCATIHRSSNTTQLRLGTCFKFTNKSLTVSTGHLIVLDRMCRVFILFETTKKVLSNRFSAASTNISQSISSSVSAIIDSAMSSDASISFWNTDFENAFEYFATRFEIIE